jgi:hypothetical protein
MDEGGILVYGTSVLQGQVPMRDMFALYGPLHPYLIGAVFKAVGPSLYAERFVGLVFRLCLAYALLTLVRRRGVGAIAAAAVLLTLLMPRDALAASAAIAALASVCVALALANARRYLLAGIAAGVTLLLRFDWILPVALASLPYLVIWSPRARARAIAGAASVTSLYVPFLVVVGSSNIHLAISELRRGQAARALPIPWFPAYAAYLLLFTLVAIALLIVIGLWRRRTDEGTSFIAIALLGIGLLPHALVRADRSHIEIAAVAPIVLLASAVPAALGAVYRKRRRLVRGLVTAAGVGIAAFVLLSMVTSAYLHPPVSYRVSHSGRSFRLADPAAARLTSLAVARADQLAPPDGRLFVGPADLRRTNYSDSDLYFLLPRLRPATYYVVLDPGVTELAPRSLASELGRADVLILNAAYDLWDEPNASSRYGSDAPNRVVARDFCLRNRYGTFRVYQRCRKA